MVGESQDTVTVGGGSGSSSNKMPTLEEYGTNLTTQATEVRASYHKQQWSLAEEGVPSQYRHHFVQIFPPRRCGKLHLFCPPTLECHCVCDSFIAIRMCNIWV